MSPNHRRIAAAAAALAGALLIAQLLLRLPLPGDWALRAVRDRSKRDMFVQYRKLGSHRLIGGALSASFRRELPGGAGVMSHQPLPGEAILGYRTTSSFPAKSVDILVLGDSVAYGYLVADDATWVSRLGRLGHWRTETLGVPGHGPGQSLELYRRYAASFESRLVLLVLVSNDPWDNLIYHDWRSQVTARETGLHAYKVHRSLDVPLWIVQPMRWLAKHSRLLESLMMKAGNAAVVRRLRREPAVVARAMELLQMDVASLRDEVEARHGKLVVVLNNSGWEHYGGSKMASAGLKGFLRSARISTLDLGASSVWKYMGQKLIIEGDGHWNERGSAFAAAEIYRFLFREGHANRLPLIGGRGPKKELVSRPAIRP